MSTFESPKKLNDDLERDVDFSAMKMNSTYQSKNTMGEFETNSAFDNLTPQEQKYLNQYHKCLYALIKILTKRMEHFYKGDFGQAREHKEVEQQFSTVLARVLTKMRQIEEKCNQSMGKEKTKSFLIPFTQTLRPIIKILGIKMIPKGD